MRPEAERDVAVVGPGDVETSGSVNARGSRFAAAYISRTSSPSRSCLAVQLVVLGDRAAHVEDRRDPADELLDRGRRRAAPGCRRSSWRWSGWSASSRIIDPITVRVVSAPPSSSSSVSSRTWPVLPALGAAQIEMRSSRGSALPFLDQLRGLLEEVLHHRAEPRGATRTAGRRAMFWPAERHGLLRPVPQQLPDARAGSRAGRRS